MAGRPECHKLRGHRGIWAPSVVGVDQFGDIDELSGGWRMARSRIDPSPPFMGRNVLGP